MLQQALLRAVERGILERGLSPAACYSWLVRTMQFELSYQQRRRQPSSRPCRGTPLPWGAVELDGEHLFLRPADDGLGERPALDDPDGLTDLTLGLAADDGAVVYLNGVEVHRVRMPDGSVGPDTRPTTWASGAQERFEESIIPAAGLMAGTNVVAVEVHNLWPGNPDLTFDLYLTSG